MTKLSKIALATVAVSALLTAGVASAQDAPAAHHHHGHKGHHHAHKGHHGHKHAHHVAEHHDEAPSADHAHDFDHLNH